MAILELLATLCAGLFSGASIYINLVEHPARMSCGTVAAIAEWAPSYKRATVMQASLAALGFLNAFAAWLSLDKKSDEARRLLERWNKLHAVRSVLSLASFLVCLYSLCRNFR
jgi:hypothetical protein